MALVISKRYGVTLSGIVWEILPCLFLWGAIVALGVVYVSSHVMAVKMGYELSTLEQQNQKLEREHAMLKLELTTLKSPTRLEKLAKEREGMGIPAPGSVIRLESP
ncbi:MAG: cell division protein FtsL [Proteobacteria bacterium]|nr:cell division protein FtsL [Cystobacterineae bacterium]MCL2258740.1 cell division protein FtsL [Cystobacterineae bacterium]MCL2314308.1 cell division protein FtsL [Pseudomonadota bacterium]